MLELISWSEAKHQTLTIGVIFITFAFAPLIGWGLYIYLLTTRLWWVSFFYSLWLYYDRDTPECGGRPISWILDSKVWRTCMDYSSLELTLTPGFNLEREKNYLFCIFPHGIVPIGSFIALTNGVCDFRKLYPNFRVQLAVLNVFLFTPFMRELIMGMGMVSCSAKSLDSILSRSSGGRIVSLSPGGVEEAYNSHPGRYSFHVQNRRGFIKTALRNGVSLVPVVTFGEVDLLQHTENRRIGFWQELIKKKVGVAPFIFYGTGFFSSFGLIPRKTPLLTVLGKPIEVSKVDNPTQDEIDDLHARFVQQLVALFDTHKQKFSGKIEDLSLMLR